MKNLVWLVLSPMLLTQGVSAEAQQAAKIRKIGWLSVASPPSTGQPNQLSLTRVRGHDRFFQGLRELGWVEGQNLVIERRYGRGKTENLADLASELVDLKVEVIVVADSTGIRPAARATSSIPIVMTVSSDPVGAGYIASLARPGGNITGLSNISPDLAGKRLEQLKEVVPKMSRVAILGHQLTVTGQSLQTLPQRWVSSCKH
jgi:putative ABC transport system substrate-binding protein